MASSTQNIVRWTALLAGIAYGATHLRSVQREQHAAHADAERKHKEQLYAQAKQAWEDKVKSKGKEALEKTKEKAEELITDPKDPKFDLAKLIEHAAKKHSPSHA